MPGPPSSDPLRTRQAVLDAVKRADSPAEYKARILLCREEGLLSDDEAEDWIAMAGLGEA